jgi:hypothetical protein
MIKEKPKRKKERKSKDGRGKMRFAFITTKADAKQLIYSIEKEILRHSINDFLII